MDASVVAIVLVMTSVLFVALLSRKSGILKRAYYQGVVFWSRWLPVIAAAAYLGTLASNVAQGEASPLYIGAPFTFIELVLLFLVGPLFLTRIGNILATATLIFSFQRFMVFGEIEASAATFLFMASLTVIAILGDKMPWIPAQVAGASSGRLREAMLSVLSIGALGVLVATIIKIYAFNRWIQEAIHLEISAYVTLTIMVMLFVGWLLVAMGTIRSVSLPLLSLPTTIALAFISGWDAYMLLIPFSMCLAFSLSSAERRGTMRRFHSTQRPILYGYGR